MTELPEDSKAGLALIAAISATFMWAAGIVIVRSVDLPGVQVAFWRVSMAAITYLLIVRVAGKRITIAHLRATVLPALAFSAEIAVFFAALKSTTVANATVIGAFQPLLLMFVASRRFGERVPLFIVASALVALGGVGLVVFGSSPAATGNVRGDLLAALATVLFAAYFALAKRARAEVPALEFQAGIWIIGTLVLAPISLIEANGVFVPSGSDWGWLSLLVIIPGTGHLLMNWAHSQVRLVITSMLTLGIPVLATASAAIFLDESISGAQWAGMAIVLTALALVIKRETDKHEPVKALV